MEPESQRGRLLIVDDDPAVLQTHARVLAEYAPLRAEDGLAARAVLGSTPVDVVLCDLGMPRLGGLDLMRWAKEHCPRPLWVVVSAQDTFDAATQALKLGAFDFIAKPILPMQLRTAVANAMRHQQLLEERADLVRGLTENNAKLAESLRELEAAYEVLREQRSMLDQDLRRAERIMRALLPQTLPSVDTMQLHVGYRPSNVIGGDLYGAAMLDDRHLAVYVADAAGHGVSAALLAVLFKQRLRLADERGEPRAPASVLDELNRGLFDECHASGLFVTVVFALVDTRAQTAIVASAGHPPAILIRAAASGEETITERIDKTGPALGLSEQATFVERQVAFAPGDRLFLYSDGLTATLPRGAGGVPADAVLKAIRGEPGMDQGDEESDGGGRAIDRLFALSERRGRSEDDVTLLLLTARSGASSVATQRQTRAASAPVESALRVGSSGDAVFVAVEGRVAWTHAPALRDACLQGSEGAVRVVIDLGRCANLDSTLLGTLHELATTPRVSLVLQSVPPELRELFEELSMARVLACIAPAPEPPPPTMHPLHGKGDAGAQQLILRAHELLASLSPRNAEEFAPVVEMMRGDLAGR